MTEPLKTSSRYHHFDGEVDFQSLGTRFSCHISTLRLKGPPFSDKKTGVVHLFSIFGSQLLNFGHIHTYIFGEILVWVSIFLVLLNKSI